MNSSSRPRKLRILQVHAALYLPYLLTRGFRQLGHKADSVYFGFRPPSSDLTWGCDYNLSGKWWAFPQHTAFLLYALAQYDIFHFWGQPYLIPALFSVFTKHLAFDLALLKKFGKKIVFQSDGCYKMIRPSVWKIKIDPQICHICQTTQGDTYGHCSNAHTIKLNTEMVKYADLRFGIGLNYDFEENAEYVFPPVDLELWNPGIKIPSKYVYAKRHPEAVLIYHGVGSHVIGNRGNIKGTVWIHETVKQLQAEGYNVELMHVERVPNKLVRFYQAQADIVVDQLVIGGGGQNAKECLALGKPVLTRMHPDQIRPYQKASAPFDPVPFIPTERENLKANLVRLIEDPGLRAEIGRLSAEFARNVLSPVASARRYVEHYQRLFAADHVRQSRSGQNTHA